MINLTREEAQNVLNLLILWLDEQEEPDTETAIETLRARLSEPDDVPKWIYKEAVPAGTETHHWAVVMHDMDKTVEGWSEDVKMYYDGKLIAPQPKPQQDWMERERAVGYREGHQAALKQREWVGLTDEEIEYIIDAYWGDPPMFIEAIEAKLKEKNNG